MSGEETPLTRGIQPGGPALELGAYRREGGYSGLQQALRAMTPGEVVEAVRAAGLRGRGGAGFSTGTKWSFMPPPERDPGPRYVIANADEMEPGTFKDRYLLEGNPHQLIEGLVLAAYAVQATQAYVFLRWAYREAGRRLERALAEARAAGLLGRDILGSAFDLDISVHVSAGRYICGEETALLNALEGKRAVPRAKPPFPQASGLWGRPTLVNNVETLCNVPHIVAQGVDWYRSLGTPTSPGTKLFGVSGRVKRPGLWELPMGTTLRDLLEASAGGMREGARLRAVLPGGASTAFLAPDQLDVALDYDAVEAAGSRLGTGTAIVLDDAACPVKMVLNLETFFAHESCGWCTPCREGLPWVAEILGSLEVGAAREGDLELLDELATAMGPGRTFCALAPGAAAPLSSGLRLFRDDFERHLDGGCPQTRRAS